MTPQGPPEPEVEGEIARLRQEGLAPLGRFLRSVGRSVLVVVDQLEELLAADQPPEPELIDLLLAPPGAGEDPARIVLTLRADYVPALVGIPGDRASARPAAVAARPVAAHRPRVAGRGGGPGRGPRGPLRARPGRPARGRHGAESLPLLQFTLTRYGRLPRHRDGYWPPREAMGRRGSCTALDVVVRRGATDHRHRAGMADRLRRQRPLWRWRRRHGYRFQRRRGTPCGRASDGPPARRVRPRRRHRPGGRGVPRSRAEAGGVRDTSCLPPPACFWLSPSPARAWEKRRPRRRWARPEGCCSHASLSSST